VNAIKCIVFHYATCQKKFRAGLTGKLVYRLEHGCIRNLTININNNSSAKKRRIPHNMKVIPYCRCTKIDLCVSVVVTPFSVPPGQRRPTRILGCDIVKQLAVGHIQFHQVFYFYFAPRICWGNFRSCFAFLIFFVHPQRKKHFWTADKYVKIFDEQKNKNNTRENTEKYCQILSFSSFLFFVFVPTNIKESKYCCLKWRKSEILKAKSHKQESFNIHSDFGAQVSKVLEMLRRNYFACKRIEKTQKVKNMNFVFSFNMFIKLWNGGE
jgi:hypothetical protein